MTPYADLAFAQKYFRTRLHADAWNEATVEDKLKALQTSSNDIDRLKFKGSKQDALQEHEFPRNDDRGHAIIANDDIKIACCEIALARLGGSDPDAEIEKQEVQGEAISHARITYMRGTTTADYVSDGIVSATAWRYLKPYLYSSVSLKLCRAS